MNDPFSEFSKIFAGEFGRALTTAWQEAITKSFANGFAPTAQTAGAGNDNPFAFFQQFMNGFPGADRSGLGGAADYLQFSQFIKPYVDMFNAGTDAADLSAQMSSVFRDGMAQFTNAAQSWSAMFQQFGHLDGASDFLSTAHKIFSNQAEAFTTAPMSVLNGDFGIGEFDHGKMPAAFGPSREWQLALDDVVKAADKLRAAQARMQEHTAATLENASERFWGELGQGEDELGSLKEVYDYWVNCAEDAYYENVMTDEYSFDFGEMINSQAEFKVKLTALIDRFLEMLNIPNRRELNGVIQQLARFEGRLDELEKFDGGSRDVGSGVSDDDEVERLKAEIIDLQAQVRSLENTKAGQAEVVSINANKKATKAKRDKKSDDDSSESEAKKKNKKRTTKKTTARKSSKSKSEPDFDIRNITSSDK